MTKTMYILMFLNLFVNTLEIKYPSDVKMKKNLERRKKFLSKEYLHKRNW